MLLLRRSTLLLLVPTLLLVALYIGYTLLSSGTYQDDDIGHYLLARWSWRHPELLLDVWGRPTWTIMHAPFAPLGLPAARIWSGVLAGAVGFGSALLAKSYGLRWSWLAIPLTGLQPEFVRQGFSTLTELSFALVLCLALLAHRQRRWTLMALAAGWLPLARYESVLILALFVIILLRERRWTLVGLALLPLLLWNGYWAFALGTWTRLLFPLDRLLLPSGVPASDYGTGPLWYYPSRLPVAFGGLIFLLAAHGAVRLRLGLMHACVAIVVGLLSLSYAYFPDATAIAGYIRHLAMVAPIIGVWALAGLEYLALPSAGWRGWATRLIVGGVGVAVGGLALIAWRTRHEIYVDAVFAVALALALGWWRPAVDQLRWLAAGCVAVAALGLLLRIAPFQRNPEQNAAYEAGRWVATTNTDARLVLAAHGWFALGWNRDLYDSTLYRSLTPAAVAQAPRGSIMVWDSHYASRLQFQTPRQTFSDPTRFQLLRDFSGTGYELLVYQKIAP